MIYRSKDVPWRVKGRRMVEHVYSVFFFGGENWSWTQQTLGQNQRMGNKGGESTISRQREKDEARSDDYTRTSRMARKYG